MRHGHAGCNSHNLDPDRHSSSPLTAHGDKETSQHSSSAAVPTHGTARLTISASRSARRLGHFQQITQSGPVDDSLTKYNRTYSLRGVAPTFHSLVHSSRKLRCMPICGASNQVQYAPFPTAALIAQSLPTRVGEPQLDCKNSAATWQSPDPSSSHGGHTHTQLLLPLSWCKRHLSTNAASAQIVNIRTNAALARTLP